MQFSRDFNDFLDPIIAPLWATFTTESSGSIFYRATNNATVLNHIEEIISNANSNYSDYQPELAIVVTWEMVPPEPFGIPIGVPAVSIM